MVENGADTWNVGEPKHNFMYLQGLQISTLEEIFLERCLKSPGTCHHVQNQSRRKRRRITHGFLRRCQPPPACQGIPEATTDRSGRTQCQAYKTGNIEQTTRGQDNKKGEQTFKENQNAWRSNVKALADTTWLFSPLCQQQ